MTLHAVTTPARHRWLLLSLLVAGSLGACGGGASTATPPTITAQPADASVVAGTAATFSVSDTPAGNSHEWQGSGDGVTWVAVPGATSSSYTTPLTSTTDSGRHYRVVVSSTGGTVTSSPATLTVTPASTAPVITAQPASQTVGAGSAATFTVAASGTPTPTLQWELSIDGGLSWTAIAGSTGATHTTAPVTLAQSGERYRAVASNGAGSTPSDAAILTVAAPGAPVITGQPASVTIFAGHGTQFVVASSGTPTPDVQWQLSTDGGATWADISGATGSTLTLLPAVPFSFNGRQYRAVVSNTVGSATSQAAVLTVNYVFLSTYQFNLFGFNSLPFANMLYGGSVEDSAGNIQCSGYVALADPCPKWRADYLNGSVVILTAKPWPGFRVSGWLGGDCGSPGTATTATLTIQSNSNCRPMFEVIPGATFSVGAVAAGPWLARVVEVVVDRFGNLVIPDNPRIDCGPLATAQVCSTTVPVADSNFTVLRLLAVPLTTAPVGNVRWSCTWQSPDDGSPVERVFFGSDVGLGPIFGDTACSAELLPS